MKKLVLLFFLVNPALFAQGNGLVGGAEFSLLVAGSSNYGWELAGVYPYLGLQIGHFRLSAFAGGSLSVEFDKEEIADTKDSYGSSNTETKVITHWSYGYGGNFDFLFDDTFVSIGGGMTGVDGVKDFSPYIRTAWGFDFDSFRVKVYYDIYLDDGSNKMGVLIGSCKHW